MKNNYIIINLEKEALLPCPPVLHQENLRLPLHVSLPPSTPGTPVLTYSGHPGSFLWVSVREILAKQASFRGLLLAESNALWNQASVPRRNYWASHAVPFKGSRARALVSCSRWRARDQGVQKSSITEQ